MKRIRFRSAPLALLVVMTLAPLALACSLVEGYFYQVTRLRGTVVGVEDHDFRHPTRWMRQQVVRGDTKLSLYRYSSSLREPSKTPPMRSTTTGKDGEFDFGVLPNGHYTLFIDVPWGSQRFDVQIIGLSRQTETVMIDVSPIYPDCKGGHEFTVTAK